MSSTKLKEDLSNCLINFDRRVLITELLDDYRLSYDEVNTIVHDFITEQEKKEQFKFEKRYLVHGLREDGNKNEIYQIVEEANLADWIKKLQNAESSLFSVEVAGGAKGAPAVFKPMRIEECVKSKSRQGTKASDANGEPEIPSVSVNKKGAKEDKCVSITKNEPLNQPLKATPKKDSSIKKTPKEESSPAEHKAVAKKAAVKKGINNFFAPSAAATKKPDEKKAASGVVKPPTPKKMMDFFKKQPEKPVDMGNLKKTAVNTSIQLFDDKDEEEPEEVESSDEEEKLEALKRDIISSDVEMEEEENASKQTPTAKRRRILDSEDEEDPPLKQEKLHVKEETKEEEAEEAVAETYLDEEGFVITKKPKQKATSTKKNSPPTKKTPPVTIKTSPKELKKASLSKDTKSASKTTTKTKQAGIMNFFSKK